jgi:hypothetical protein
MPIEVSMTGLSPGKILECDSAGVMKVAIQAIQWNTGVYQVVTGLQQNDGVIT